MEPQTIHVPVEQVQFWWNLVAYVITGLAAVVVTTITVTWRVSQKLAAWKEEFKKSVDETDEKFSKALVAAIDNGDQKRKRIYERFDEHKKDVEEKFVKKEMCNILHQGTANVLVEFKTEMRHQFQNTSKEIADLRNLILGNKPVGGNQGG